MGGGGGGMLSMVGNGRRENGLENVQKLKFVR